MKAKYLLQSTVAKPGYFNIIPQKINATDIGYDRDNGIGTFTWDGDELITLDGRGYIKASHIKRLYTRVINGEYDADYIELDATTDSIEPPDTDQVFGWVRINVFDQPDRYGRVSIRFSSFSNGWKWTQFGQYNDGLFALSDAGKRFVMYMGDK